MNVRSPEAKFGFSSDVGHRRDHEARNHRKPCAPGRASRRSASTRAWLVRLHARSAAPEIRRVPGTITNNDAPVSMCGRNPGVARVLVIEDDRAIALGLR